MSRSVRRAATPQHPCRRTRKCRRGRWRDLVLAIGFTLSCAAAPSWGAKEPADPDPHRFDKEVEVFGTLDRAPTRPVDTLFVGSSSIRLWDLDKSFPKRGYLNRGFGGAQTSDILHFAPEVIIRYRPRRIVYFCGVNDIAAGKSPERVLRDFRRLVKLVRAEIPDIEWIVLAHKPSPARAKFLPQVQRANELFANHLRDDPDGHFVSATFDQLVDAAGEIRTELFVDDRIHMNEEGYRLWTSAVDGVLRREEGTAPVADEQDSSKVTWMATAILVRERNAGRNVVWGSVAGGRTR